MVGMQIQYSFYNWKMMTLHGMTSGFLTQIALCVRHIRFNLLNDTQNTIVIELLLDFLMLVNWDGCWCMNNYRDCIWLILISTGGPDILGNV